jgi:hypothetical protein
MYLKMLHRRIKWRTTSPGGRPSPLDQGLAFTVRFAYPDDHVALRRLAALDSSAPLPGPLLVAEVGGELWAAVSLVGDPRAIADPFHHTAELVALLRERADRTRGQPSDQPAPVASYSSIRACMSRLQRSTGISRS